MNSDSPSTLVAASPRVVLQTSPQNAIAGIDVAPNNTSPMCQSAIGDAVDFRGLAHQGPLGSNTLVHNNNQIVSDTTITSTQIPANQSLIQSNIPVPGVIVQSSPPSMINLSQAKSKQLLQI